jgi:hypothetical protein
MNIIDLALTTFSEGAATVEEQATALAGAAVEAKVAGTHPSMVLEHGNATFVIDDVTVHLRAYDKLNTDQAAAWLAQQDQTPDDTTVKGGGL